MSEHAGLSILRGRVVRFTTQKELKIPHTGWNQIWQKKESPLLLNIQCVAEDESDTIAETDYGIHYTSIVQCGYLFGVQFHPEKSQRVGLTILENFLAV